MNKKNKKIKAMGSDCVYCHLDEGVYCMVYFCKKKSSENNRVICEDDFSGTCELYKKIKE